MNDQLTLLLLDEVKAYVDAMRGQMTAAQEDRANVLLDRCYQLEQAIEYNKGL